MRLTREDILNHLFEDEELFVLFSAIPAEKKEEEEQPKLIIKGPMLMEAQGNKMIQAWIFSTVEEANLVIRDMIKNGRLCGSVRYEKKNLRPLMILLAECGVEVISYHKGEDSGEVSMKEERIVELLSVENPNQAQRDLTRDVTLYWQQIYHNMYAKAKNKAPQAALTNSELLRLDRVKASLLRAGLIIPVVPSNEDEKVVAAVLFADKDAEGNTVGKKLMAFTNPIELSHHFGGKMPKFGFFSVAQISKMMKDNELDRVFLNYASSSIVLTASVLEEVLAMKKLLNDAETGEKEMDEEIVNIHLRTDREFYTIYTAAAMPGKEGQKPLVTLRNPYVVENQETYNDEYWIFADKEEAMKEVQKIRDELNLFVMVREWTNVNFKDLFTALASKAVNTIVYHKGGKQCEFELDKLVTLPKNENVDENQRPIINPTLELSALYYWKELAKGKKFEERTDEEKQVFLEKSEEFLVNLRKSEFYIRFVVAEQDGKKVQAFPMEVRKDEAGNVVSAQYFLFTDIYEMQKFFGPYIPPMMAKLSFAKLKDLLSAPECTGVVFDPAGVEIRYAKDAMMRILGLQTEE